MKEVLSVRCDYELIRELKLLYNNRLPDIISKSIEISLSLDKQEEKIRQIRIELKERKKIVDDLKKEIGNLESLLTKEKLKQFLERMKKNSTMENMHYFNSINKWNFSLLAYIEVTKRIKEFLTENDR